MRNHNATFIWIDSLVSNVSVQPPLLVVIACTIYVVHKQQCLWCASEIVKHLVESSDRLVAHAPHLG